MGHESKIKDSERYDVVCVGQTKTYKDDDVVDVELKFKCSECGYVYVHEFRKGQNEIPDCCPDCLNVLLVESKYEAIAQLLLDKKISIETYHEAIDNLVLQCRDFMALSASTRQAHTRNLNSSTNNVNTF